jgi:TIR domain
MPRIVISYRRADTGQIVGRISDWLADRYGKESVFVDIDNIPFGVDFRRQIYDVLLKTDILIAAIGDDWLGSGATGQSRLLQDTDPVRVEIETALERKITIIPVLIDGAKMPEPNELPATFDDFAYLNAPTVSSGRDFRSHMERLIVAIDQIAAKGDPDAAVSSPVPVAGESGTQMRPAAGRADLSDWRADTVRYFVAPLIALLVVHYGVVNSLNLNTLYLRVACVAIPLAFGFALFWIARRGAGSATAFGLALGLVGVIGMSVSESLYSGDPMLPQTRFEWLDNLQFAGTITLSFIVGHLAGRVSRAVMRRNVRKA